MQIKEIKRSGGSITSMKPSDLIYLFYTCNVTYFYITCNVANCCLSVTPT